MAPRNPYTPFAPAETNFVGRGEIISLFSSRLVLTLREEGDPRHLLLEGVGGIGKTSLLKRLLAECKCHRGRGAPQAILVDMRDLFAGPQDFVVRVEKEIPQLREASRVPRQRVTELRNHLKEVLRSVEIGYPVAISVQPFAWYGVSRQESKIDEIAGCVELLLKLAKTSKRRLVLLVDRFDNAVQMPGGLVFAWHISELMRRSREDKLVNLLVVLAVRPDGRWYLESQFNAEILGENFVKRVVLPPLTLTEALAAVLEPARREGVCLSTELATALVEQAGSHPYFLQLAAYRTWEYLGEKNLLGVGEVTSDMIPLTEIVRDCEAKIFADFTAEERYVLRVMARSPMLGLTPMQLKEAIDRDGKIKQVNADDVLQALVRHKHRPITYNPSKHVYSFTHVHFRDYVRDNELTSEEREIAALEGIIDSTAALDLSLDRTHLGRLWKYRQLLRLDEDRMKTLVNSELRAFPSRRQWIDWLHRSDALRLAGILLEALQSPSVVYRAVSIVGDLRLAQAVDPLIELLGHGTQDIRMAAALGLGKIGNPRATGPLITMLGAKKWEERRAAVQALSTIGKADVVDPLTAALKDRSQRVRAAAAESLGKTGNPRVIPALTAALHESSEEVASAAAEALAGIDDPQATQALTDAVLRSRVPMTRLLSLLKDRGIALTVDGLLPGLSSKDSLLRARAVEAIYRVDRERAIDLLIQCLDDESDAVRRNARIYLRLTGNPRAMQAVARARRVPRAVKRRVL